MHIVFKKSISEFDGICLDPTDTSVPSPLRPRKKITDTKFPYPFAQIIAIFLLLHLILTPALITASVPHKVYAPLITFITVFGMFALSLRLQRACAVPASGKSSGSRTILRCSSFAFGRSAASSRLNKMSREFPEAKRTSAETRFCHVEGT